MQRMCCCLLLCQLLVAVVLAKDHRISFKGQCPKFKPLPQAQTTEKSITGNWYQYAVHPNYLQDKCIRREYYNIPSWAQFAYTDYDNFIIQYFCFEQREHKRGCKHERSISIFVREPVPTVATVAIIENALKRHFKFPMNLLNYTDYTYCTEIESKEAIVRA